MAPTPAGRDPDSVTGVLEQLSPELVLVSPELGEIARALLPDRPWETFLPPACPCPTSPAVPLPQEATPSSPAIRREVGSRRVSPRSSVVVVHRLILAGFVALLVVGSVLPARDAPTLAPASGRQLGTPTIDKQRVVQSITAPVQKRPTPSPARLPDARSTPATRARPATAMKEHEAVPTQSPGAARPRTSVPSTPTARGPSRPRAFRFAINRRSHLVERFEGTLRCAGRVVLVNIAIGADRRFSVVHRFSGGGQPVIIWLDGSVDLGDRIHGTFRVHRYPCDTGHVPFVARAKLE